MTRDIKPPGQCPACDEYHRQHPQEGDPATTSPDGLPVVQPVHHWYRPRNIIGGTVVVAIGITAISLAAGGGHKAATAPAPRNTPSAVATTNTPEAATGSGSVLTWITGPGYDNLLAVKTDVSNVSQDASAQDVAAVEQDGAQLTRDANAAAGTPPPIGTAEYSAAMRQYAAAGTDMQSDDFTSATRHLNQGTVLVGKVSAKLNPAGV
jgi:hypothetical protein